jgi:hypothetical protein
MRPTSGLAWLGVKRKRGAKTTKKRGNGWLAIAFFGAGLGFLLLGFFAASTGGELVFFYFGFSGGVWSVVAVLAGKALIRKRLSINIQVSTSGDSERDRWILVAGSATCMAGKSEDEQVAFLRAILEKFADVPDVEPDPDDTQAIAKYAVKLLLRALLDDGVMQRQ